MPSEVYLIPDMNAWVAQRGGIMGYGSRRVMGVELPLLQILNLSQFKAVVAHEFGHYHSGDTKLGPWIYKTRSTIGRTLQNLTQVNRVIRVPFEGYAKMFLRVTHSISRHQEFVADQLATGVVGAKALADALKNITGNAQAFLFYVINTVSPVLEVGYKPPILEGSGRFSKSEIVSSEITAIENKAMEQKAPDPYNTHPSLGERLEVLQGMPPKEIPHEEALAISLMDELLELETYLLSELFRANKEAVQKLQPIEWDDRPAKVLVPSWRKLVQLNFEVLHGVNPVSLIEISKDAKTFGMKFKEQFTSKLSPERLTEFTLDTLAAALGLALLSKQWSLHADLGQEIYLSHLDRKVDPFKVLYQLSSGELSGQEWREECERCGLTDFDFGTMKLSE